MGYFHRGRHRAPTHTTQRAAAVAGAALIPLMGIGTAHAATDPLGAIAQCESSGNPRASNGTHFGLYQFDLATWVSVGGSGNPMDASPAEQTMRARLLLAARGTQPWDASKSCWAGKSAPLPPHAVAKPAPAKAAPAVPHATKPSWAAAAAHGSYTVHPGDTLSGIAPGHWRQVWAANRATIGDNPDLIFPGQRLTL